MHQYAKFTSIAVFFPPSVAKTLVMVPLQQMAIVLLILVFMVEVVSLLPSHTATPQTRRKTIIWKVVRGKTKTDSDTLETRSQPKTAIRGTTVLMEKMKPRLKSARSVSTRTTDIKEAKRKVLRVAAEKVNTTPKYKNYDHNSDSYWRYDSSFPQFIT